MKQFIDVIKAYADFKNRLSRRDFWIFILFNILFSIVASALDMIFHSTYSLGSGAGIPVESGLFESLYSLFVFIPGLAAGVRRLHDTGKSGWMMLLLLIPIIGWIWILVLWLSGSYPGENEYGPEPETSASGQ